MSCNCTICERRRKRYCALSLGASCLTCDLADKCDILKQITELEGRL